MFNCLCENQFFLAMRGDANQKYYSGDELVATCDPVTIRE